MTSESERIAQLRAVRDPLARAIACQTFLTNGRKTIETAQRIRDQAIREVKKAKVKDATTIDEIAAKLGVKRNIVVDALREPE